MNDENGNNEGIQIKNNETGRNQENWRYKGMKLLFHQKSFQILKQRFFYRWWK